MIVDNDEINSLIWAIEADNFELVAERVKKKPQLRFALNFDGISAFSRCEELGRERCLKALLFEPCLELSSVGEMDASELAAQRGSLLDSTKDRDLGRKTENGFSFLIVNAARRLGQSASESRLKLILAERNAVRESSGQDVEIFSPHRGRG